ncbi:hypothetical protein H5410_042577 [Solanum commersonii]|uniref:Uncharacterized protein n=1 Tax=Solanum commersonii TaxID=4109 RepID=A0A9J5XWR6_SOLCO|nr:hypothetical protein H5410_042577 [Solanum commersonii]
MKYLSCPINRVRKRKENYLELFEKIKDSRNKHWSKWIDICLPKIEGGLIFKSMFDKLKLCMQNFGGISKHKIQCGLTLCGLSISIWFGKILVASLMQIWNSDCSSNYKCYVNFVEETIEHLFIKGEAATRIWNYFRYALGILDPILNLKQFIRLWWYVEGNYRVKLVCQDIYMPKFGYKNVRSKPPPNNMLKCNADRASKGNIGPDSTTFYIRNHNGNFQINHFQDIPIEERKILNLDKQRAPHIRRTM